MNIQVNGFTAACEWKACPATRMHPQRSILYCITSATTWAHFLATFANNLADKYRISAIRKLPQSYTGSSWHTLKSRDSQTSPNRRVAYTSLQSFRQLFALDIPDPELLYCHLSHHRAVWQAQLYVKPANNDISTNFVISKI